MFIHDGEKNSLCVARNISERKRLEEVLAAREQKFRSLVESFPDLIISYDRDGRIRYLNSAMLRELELVSAEACIGKRPGEFWPDGRFTEIEQAAKQVVESGAETTLEFPRPSPVGELRIHEVRIVPEQDVAGQIIGTIAVGRDITERKRLEEELIKTEKLESLGVLAGGIAHDFNNLLMGIMGHISLVGQHVPAQSDAAKSLEIATRTCQSAMELSRRLLTFAKGGEPIKKTLDLAPLLRDCLSLHARNMRVELHVAADLGQVEADEGQLFQVFVNLVVNANQAMPDGGTLSVYAENMAPECDDGNPAECHVRITFADDGCGIPEEILPKIFDPYFTTKPGGSGIGLATSHSIVVRHGGRLSVSSRPGGGSVFTVYLPSCKEPSPALPFSTPRKSVVRDKQAILVMDDEEMIRTLMRMLLTSLGYHPTLSADGAEALALYREAMEAGMPFAAVSLDLNVPNGMGGKEAARQILSYDPEACLIVASGYSDDPVMASPKEYGFRAVLAKPFTIGQLKAALCTLGVADAEGRPLSQSFS